ncbi:sensor histidine kinase [Mucilaginibacter pedocola]|uniref:Histidine kinase n=1 Tax=Mucilaginibacter pedocola TaxID=1792845 RepID=A0A1S9PIV2_9SPHI|nr:histidine kinase [Mucilaginibacter pedocola]OOQ60859.1 histidine kinase [Mucilaginibacter pedocola]
MYKTYHIRWCITLCFIILVSSLLLRQVNPVEIAAWEYISFLFRLFSTTFVCWLIHGYFLLHNMPAINKFKVVVSNLAAMAAVSVMAEFFTRYLPEMHFHDAPTSPNPLANLLVHIMRAFFLSIICYVVFYSVNTNAALQQSKIENQLLEQAHLRAQLLSLQQQISPHFMFNSLSTLKTIATDQPTKNYIVQLASVYRYVLNFNEHYLTNLQNELNFIRSYLYILGQRFEEALQVTITIPDEHLQYQIPPLSLQLLVENAVKHNTVSPDQPLHITITTTNAPSLIVENNFQPKKTPEEGTGTGLKNIKERYRLLMNKPIEVENTGGKFSVTLPLLAK